MGKSRIKTKTSYFIVTPNGKLRRLNMSLVLALSLVILVALGLFSRQSYILNQQLIAEEQHYLARLSVIDANKKQLEEDLMICEQKKEDISKQLYFNTDSEKTADEK
jgi:cytoskeletal protein RodZ